VQVQSCKGFFEKLRAASWSRPTTAATLVRATTELKW
jgi:hypothetical protein